MFRRSLEILFTAVEKRFKNLASQFEAKWPGFLSIQTRPNGPSSGFPLILFYFIILLFFFFEIQRKSFQGFRSKTFPATLRYCYIVIKLCYDIVDSCYRRNQRLSEGALSTHCLATQHRSFETYGFSQPVKFHVQNFAK